MRDRARSTRPALAALLVALPLVATGCTTSQKAPYARHLAQVVPQGSAPTNDVAVAFGLDEYRAPSLAQRPLDDSLSTP